jgi:hypothetical protein
VCVRMCVCIPVVHRARKLQASMQQLDAMQSVTQQRTLEQIPQLQAFYEEFQLALSAVASLQNELRAKDAVRCLIDFYAYVRMQGRMRERLSADAKAVSFQQGNVCVRVLHSN